MQGVKLSNIPTEPLRWSVTDIEREFDLTRITIGKRLLNANALPDQEGCWSTKQVTSALFGDLHGEKVRLTKEQADGHALSNAEARGELINRQSIFNALETLFTSAAQIIISSDLSKDEQDDILSNWAHWPIQLDNSSKVNKDSAQKPEKSKKTKSKKALTKIED